jgi:hypothetical protein
LGGMAPHYWAAAGGGTPVLSRFVWARGARKCLPRHAFGVGGGLADVVVRGGLPGIGRS